MLHEIALVYLAPAYSLTRFISFQTNGALWPGSKGSVNVPDELTEGGWQVSSGSKEALNSGNGVSIVYFSR
jgi:hypothetical protein